MAGGVGFLKPKLLLPRKIKRRRENSENRDEILAGMDSISISRRAFEPRSGGKILRARRRTRARTPYERSPLTESPNWLARLLCSPARSIFTGAGKVLSSVFGSDSDASSEIDSDDDEIVSSEEDELNERNGALGPLFRRGETKHTIEKLLRQEIFSRDECDTLIEIVKSRVVEDDTSEDAENTRIGASSQHGRLRPGTWNIQDEIKRVRTKATEEILRSLPNSKIDWSFSWENRSNLNSLQDGKQGADLGDKHKIPKTVECLNVDPSLEITSTHNTDVMEYGLQKEAMPSGTEQPNLNVEETIQDSMVYDKPCSTTEKHATFNTSNCFASSEPSLSSQVCREETTLLNGEINQASSSQGKIGIHIFEEKTYELDNVMAPTTKANDTNCSKNTDAAASGSRNSSGIPDRLTKYNRRRVRPRGK